MVRSRTDQQQIGPCTGKTTDWEHARRVLTFQELQVIGDLLQDDKAWQDQAYWASQPRIGLLTAIGPVPLAILQQTCPSQTALLACMSRTACSMTLVRHVLRISRQV